MPVKVEVSFPVASGSRTEMNVKVTREDGRQSPIFPVIATRVRARWYPNLPRELGEEGDEVHSLVKEAFLKELEKLTREWPSYATIENGFIVHVWQDGRDPNSRGFLKDAPLEWETNLDAKWYPIEPGDPARVGERAEVLPDGYVRGIRASEEDD